MNPGLDLKDRKILFELEQDSRQSFKKIAKKVGLQKETVFHRIKSLEKKGIIENYITEINIYKLGYIFVPMLIRFQNTTPTSESEMYNYLKHSQYTSWLSHCEGSWDINLNLIASSAFELQKFFDAFLERFSTYIAEKEILLVTEVHYFKKAFWLEETTMKVTSTGGDKRVKVEKIDLELLKTLSNDARKPRTDISRQLNIHPKTVAKRIKHLEKKGIILGSRIRVNFSKMGYRFYKIFFSLKKINKKVYRRILGYLHLHPNVIWTTKLLGAYDLSIEIAVAETQQFRSFLDEFKDKFSENIKRHYSLLIFEESVMDYLPIK